MNDVLWPNRHISEETLSFSVILWQDRIQIAWGVDLSTNIEATRVQKQGSNDIHARNQTHTAQHTGRQFFGYLEEATCAQRLHVMCKHRRGDMYYLLSLFDAVLLQALYQF